MKNYQRALHVFRRDLRLHDNTALLAALNQAVEVLPGFIFDPRQLQYNDYRSDHCVQFMLGSLEDLQQQLAQTQNQLYFFEGEAEKIIERLIQECGIDAVFLNRDYTPFSERRDANIAKVCKKLKIDFHVYGDLLLTEPEQVKKSDGSAYTVFTPFMRAARQLPVAKPVKNIHNNYFKDSISFAKYKIPLTILSHKNPKILLTGGRREAIKLLQESKSLKNYAETRNLPSQHGTTFLSAHNKFGTLSIREVYHYFLKEFGGSHTLINELYWRDFFTHIASHFPRVFGGAFYEKYNKLPWNKNKESFECWCAGETGFPIVDAGMRQMNTTGYMHNRVRMIVASFLVKDLHVDWQWGEKYFASKLMDYDPAVNNGNWQWAASTGCDAQPYFRIFNPWLQQQKYDPDCLYIKEWIPELKNTSVKEIHSWPEIAEFSATKYIKPIVDHSQESAKSREIFKKN